MAGVRRLTGSALEYSYASSAARNHPPDGSTSLIRRNRLGARLEDVRSSPLTMLLAPAGYGKSSLMAQWFEALGADSERVAWMTLDLADRNPGRLLSRLAQALNFRAGSSDASRERPNSRRGDANLTPFHIVGRFVGAGEPVFLLIDDAQQIAGSPAEADLSALIECAPTRLHIVIASRERLAMPLARWRALGRLAELEAADLRFDAAEIAAFLKTILASPFDAAAIDDIEMRTEGWPAGLRLAVTAARRTSDPCRVLSTFSGEWRQVADYFLEDVLAAQPEEVQQFLLRTSLLDRLCPSLCDAVTGGSDARRLLDLCEAKGLFITPTDRQGLWRRSHPVFAEVLRRKLKEEHPEDVRSLHRLASDWLFQHGHHIEAFEQSISAEDPTRAADILQLYCEDFSDTSRQRVALRLAEKIPEEIRNLYPQIMLSGAWQLITEWRFDHAQSFLAAARARLQIMETASDADDAEIRALQHLLLHREMVLAQFKDEMALAERQCDTLLRAYDGPRDSTKGRIYTLLINSRRELYKLQDLDRLDALAREHIQREAQPLLASMHDATIGLAFFAAGRCDDALEALHRGFDTAMSLPEPSSWHCAAAALPLAEVCYEQNQLEGARALVDRHLSAATDQGLGDQLVSGWLTHARLLHVCGDTRAALRALDQASVIAKRRSFDRLRLFVGVERMRLLGSLGRPGDAISAAEELGLPSSLEDVLPSESTTTRDEARALAWVRLAQIHNRIADALKVTRRWHAFVGGARALRSVIRWQIVLTELLLLDGQTGAAQRIFRQAAVNAMPQGFLRSFLDGGVLITDLLRSQTESARGHDAVDDFLRELNRALDQQFGPRQRPLETDEAVPILLAALSAKEVEILTLTGSGMRNREIASKLGMTEGSVKWYLQQIYDKLGVRTRSKALEGARRLGIVQAKTI